MNGHPGGLEHTRGMLALAGLRPGAEVLDMGAGAGESLALLREKGYAARGIDLHPRSPAVERGDLLRTGWPAESLDAVLSQCAFYVAGDIPGALREAWRLLREGGLLLLSDVEFEPLRPLVEAVGFAVIWEEDLTAQWREYYLEALWRGEGCGCAVPRGKCGYKMLIGRKEQHGPV